MRPGLITVIRDASLWVGGWTIIFKQAGIFFAPPSQVSEFLVAVAASMIGVPGILQLWINRPGVTPTGSSSGSAAPQASSPSSPGGSSAGKE